MASKDILWEGTWTYPDGRVLTVTEKDLRNAAHQGTRMLQSGLVVPWCWDHQPGATPAPVEMSLSVLGDPNVRAKVARNTIPAATKAFRVEEKVRDGKKRKVLVAEFDDARLSAAEKKGMTDAGRVSCRVARNLWDARGNGRVYSGLVVQHIAVTPSALEPDQGEFQMSLAALPELARGKCDEFWDMAGGKNEDDEDETTQEPDGDEVVEPDAVDPAILTADTAPPALPVPAAPVPLGPPPEMGEILQSLSLMGLKITPEKITDLKSLALALSLAADMGKELKGVPGAGDPDADLTATVGAGASPPMMMSQSEMYAKAPDIVERHRKSIRAGIGLAHKDGQLSGPMYDQLLAEFEGPFEMSYYQSGRLKANQLIRDLDTLRRRIPRGTFGKRTAGAAYDLSVAGLTADGEVAPVPPPAQYRERDGMAALDKLMDESLKKLGVPPTAAA